jgi:hypothetical protein
MLGNGMRKPPIGLDLELGVSVLEISLYDTCIMCPLYVGRGGELPVGSNVRTN